MNDEAISPVGVTEVLVHRASPHVEWVEVDGEVVAWNEDAMSLHLLDPVSALVFQLLDGVEPLSTTIADLAATFAQDPSVVETDVLRLTEALLESGLVERIS